MKRITIRYIMIFTVIVLLEASGIRASEPKSLVQDILTNPKNRWKKLHLLPSQLIGSMILHNHPIVLFILNRSNSVVTNLALNIFDTSCCFNRFAKFNSSGDKVLTASIDDTAKIWDANRGGVLHFLEGNRIRYAQYNRSGDKFLTANKNEIKLWETKSGKCLRTEEAFQHYADFAKFTSSGDMIIMPDNDGNVKLCDTNSGKCLHTLSGVAWGTHFAEFNGSGNRVLIGYRDGTAKLFDVNSGKCLHTLITGHTWSIDSVEFKGSEARVLIAASRDKTARLYDTNSGECLQSWQDTLAKLNASGDLVVTASGRTAKLWDANSGKGLHTLVGHTGSVNFGIFNNSGNSVLTGSNDGTAKLWDTHSGTCFQTLAGHSKNISCGVFNRVGDMVLTGCCDGTAELWDTTSGQHLQTLPALSSLPSFIVGCCKITSAEFNNSDDRVLIFSGESKSRRNWLYDISEFLKLRNFFSRDNNISLNQALLLVGIYEIIIYRKLLRKTLGTYQLYFQRLKDTLKDLSSSTERQALSSDRVVFDFRTCSHLQLDYEKLPQEIQRILDHYVRKVPSKNDCSTASTTDEYDFESVLTSSREVDQMARTKQKFE